MALFTVLKALVDDNINTNGIQYITGAIHNDVMNELIDAVGAAQVYVNPATTDNPGTPANNRAYIALPGVYTNFGGLEITAPLGVLSWDGTSWTATQLAMPSPSDYFKCKTTAALTATTNVNSVAISILAGTSALKNDWVKIVSRRTGVFEFLRLNADVADSDTIIYFDPHNFENSYEIGAILDFNPSEGLVYDGCILHGDGTNTYIDMPTGWQPPLTAGGENSYVKGFQIVINGMEGVRVDTPVTEFEYDLNYPNRRRIEFAQIMTTNDRVVVRCLQPKIYS